MALKKDLPIRPSEMGLLNIITNTEGPHTPVVLAEMLSVSKPMILLVVGEALTAIFCFVTK